MYPPLDLTKPDPANFKLVVQMKNAKVYHVTVPNDGGNATASYYLTHLWGSYYDMGVAQAVALEKAGVSISTFMDKVWAHMEQTIEQALPNYFPTWFSEILANFTLDIALDFTEYITAKFTDPKFIDELRGLADGSGADFNTIYRVHMIAGLTQGKCSMFGIWGKALSPMFKGGLLQLRALDWDMDGPFRDYSAVTVYHPNDGTNRHMSIGMTGFVGGLTGVSDQQLGISEIGVSYPDASFGDESRFGVPFIFLLRDILRYDKTVDDATTRMANAKRTCDLILGVGDGKLSEFKGYGYSSSYLRVFDDKNLQPAADWHPRIPDVVYWGMDWLCPAYNTVLSEQITKYYGQITPEIAIRYLTAIEMSGDNHLAFYDLGQMLVYVSFARPNGVEGPLAAYDRQFVKFNATQLFEETQPTGFD